MIEIFLEVFSTLPYRVLWKFNPEEIPKKFENILISKWLPQQGVLGNVTSANISNATIFVYYKV